LGVIRLTEVARSNTVKQLDSRNRGNLECKSAPFLAQISVQINTWSIERPFTSLLTLITAQNGARSRDERPFF
jgi:hypothetical protein